MSTVLSRSMEVKGDEQQRYGSIAVLSASTEEVHLLACASYDAASQGLI